MFDLDVLVPRNLTELADLLAKSEGSLIAGGTDMLPAIRRASHRDTGAAPISLIDMSRLSELCFIRKNGGQIEIGALTTHAAMAVSPLLLQSAPALAKACSEVGSPQTRTRGTLGGNLVHASPAADAAPPLLCLDASVLLINANGHRVVRLNDFFSGPGQTCLLAGEFLHSISFAVPDGRWGAAGLRLGCRNGMSIAVVSVSVFLELDTTGSIGKARIALGSVAATPVRGRHVEAVLQGQQPTRELFALAAQAVDVDITPISDVRASSAYRRHSARILLSRVLETAHSQAESRCA